MKEMAWRPNEYLVEGELDNTNSGKVTGWMKFKGRGKISFDLKGNFHRDIRGTKIKFIGDGKEADFKEAKKYMSCFSIKQTGETGDITAGKPTGKNEDGKNTFEYVKYPYIEWYGNENGRVVLELDDRDIEIIGNPIPVMESFPIDRQKEGNKMMSFLQGMCEGLGG